MRTLLNAVALSSLSFAQVVEVPVMAPVSQWEPPAAKLAVSLAESTAAAPKNLLTVGERSEWRETGRYTDSVAFARALEKASPWVRTISFGKSPQGRDLIATIVSKDRAFTPEAARKTGKLIVLLESCIHPGEVDGKEAGEMLLRDVAVTKRYAAWLDQVILINIPIFNVDGHEIWSGYNRINQQGPNAMGFRATAQRLNLNRDFLKADAPEMQAWLRFFNAWLPDFFIDNHVTDGADFQYDVSIDTPMNQDIWENLARWTRERYLPALQDAMTTDGHVMGPYGGFRQRGRPESGFQTLGVTPRYSNGYLAAQNRPSLLVETHSLKTFKTRSWGHYNIMKRSIEILVRDPKTLWEAVREADRAVAALAGAGTAVHLDGDSSDETKPFTFRALRAEGRPSTLAGGPVLVYQKETLDIPTKIFDRMKTTLAATVPKGYYVPAEWSEVIERLALHGVRTERTTREVRGEFATYRLTEPKWSTTPFEGRLTVDFRVTPVKEKRVIPAGSVYVPMNQRAARVALNLLEPAAPDSLVRWGFLNSIFEQKEYFSDYVFEPIAQEMARRHPELLAEFNARVKADVRFAGNPRARLQWWYERSPYLEPDKNAYPIVRVE
ncbi:MAG: M14 family metallopeptidase [Acidobacteria bacterium]|nr:M14 family metallopeptidase [Acidobacteriota bacterium]